jgi:hypothetical protein
MAGGNGRSRQINPLWFRSSSSSLGETVSATTGDGVTAL